MKEVLLKEYKNLKNLKLSPLKEKYIFSFNFIRGAFFEIKGRREGEFDVKFLDGDKVIYQTTLKNNMWTKCSRAYYTKWNIVVTDKSTNEVIFNHKYNAENKRVYIHLDSKAIGDTLAWFPHVDEFRKKHNCKVIVSTFHNEWFESQYPELEFVKPGGSVENIYAQYSIGWFYNENKKINYSNNPIDFRTIPLGKTSSDILGLDYKEIKPKLSFKKKKPSIEGRYVCIAPHASAHAKYWNYPGGWQKIIDYFNEKGIKVLLITREPLGDAWHDSKLGGTLTGVIDKTGEYSIEDRSNDLIHSEGFIGLGSGLSWLSWSLNTPTILISGFSEPYSEFEDCERIFTPNNGTCKGCFNKHRLDPGDWEWCPEHKNTERMFECTKEITPLEVKKSINKIINF